MTPSDQWARARSVCERIWDRNLQGDEATLLEACLDDAQLVALVQDVLAGDRSAGGFLESPPVLISDDPPEERAEELPPGTKLGRYEILRKLAEGGMGQVYEARQERPARRVALKLLPMEYARPGSARRFEREAEALGRLRHPNIAQIYEAGSCRVPQSEVERPYLAMELIDGVAIDVFIERKTPTIHERVGLVVDVCCAITHAHQRGIIHRDIKPSNVLVTEIDGRAIPKVIDFGIARLDDQDWSQTVTDASRDRLVGSIPYMSPEQVRGGTRDVDVRSDAYSLGVLLYQLLTGCLPYEGESVFEFIRAIGEGAIVRPRRRSPTIANDLEAIVLTALETEPQRRYQSVAEFTLDLRRFLAGEIVPVARSSALERAVKIARKHKTASLVTGVSVIVLALGTTAVAWQAVRASRADARSRANLEELRSASSMMITEMESALLNLRGATTARRLLVERGIEILESLGSAADSDDDDELMRDLASGYHRIGMLQGHPNSSNIGDPLGASESLYRSVEYWRQVCERNADSLSDHDQLAHALQWLGVLEISMGRVESGLDHVHHALRVVEDLCRRSPARFQGSTDVVDHCWLAAKYLDRRGRSSEIPVLRDRAVRHIRSYPRDNPTGIEELYNRVSIAIALGNLHAMAGDPERGLESFARGEEYLDSLLASGTESFIHWASPANFYRYRAQTHWHAGDPDRAIEDAHRSIDATRAVIDMAPGRLDFPDVLAETHATLASWLLEIGRLDEAFKQSARAAELSASLVTQNPGDQRIWFNQCSVLLVHGRCLAAIAQRDNSRVRWIEARDTLKRCLQVATEADDSGNQLDGSMPRRTTIAALIQQCDSALSPISSTPP